MNDNHNHEPVMVTIISSTYNHEPYIRQCLEGFVMQKTNFKFEAVVHDDASTDRTADIIREYEAKYPDIIKPIYQKTNGYGSERNAKAKREVTRGKYIAVCEGDDYWTDPYKLQKQVDFLEADKNQDYSLVYTDADIYYEDTKYRQTAIIRNGLSLLDNDNPIKSRGYFVNFTWLFRKTVWEMYTPDYGGVDNGLVMFYEVAQQTKIHFIPEVTGTYRKHFGSASCHIDKNKQLKFDLKSYEIKLNYVNKYKIDEGIAFPVLFCEAVSLLERSVELNDESAIEFLVAYLKQKNITPEIIVNAFYQRRQLTKEIIQIRSSKAYHLGKFLLKPLSYIRHNIKKCK